MANLDSAVHTSGEEDALTVADGDAGDSTRVIVVRVVGVLVLLVRQVVHHRDKGAGVRFLVAVEHPV